MSETPAPVNRGAHLADPGPLGLAAFALTTFVLSFINTGLFKAEPAVFGLTLAYGGIAQFGAGMWEFAKGNTFGALAFTSYGAFWLSFWYLNTHTDWVDADKKPIPAADVAHGVALYLLAWTIFTLYMTVAASRVNLAVLAVFVLLTVTFLLLTIANFGSGSETLTKAGGWFGIATAVAAWYTSFAGVTKFTFGRDLLPVGAR